MAGRIKTDRDALAKGAAHEHLAEVRCHMFGLEALLRAHVEREERYLIPLLANDDWATTTDALPVGAKASSEAG